MSWQNRDNYTFCTSPYSGTDDLNCAGRARGGASHHTAENSTSGRTEARELQAAEGEIDTMQLRSSNLGSRRQQSSASLELRPVIALPWVRAGFDGTSCVLREVAGIAFTKRGGFRGS